LAFAFRRLKRLRFAIVRSFPPFAFLRLSKRSLTIVSFVVSGFRSSHLNLILDLRLSDNMHLQIVNPFHQFAFLPPLNNSVPTVLLIAARFRSSHSKPFLGFRVLDLAHFEIADPFHQFRFLARLAPFVGIPSVAVIVLRQ
jgi:hypothetical protein